MSSKNQNTKNRILNCTLELLETGQAEKVRMSDIAKAAGVSRQAVYLHFPNRAELLIATTRYLDEIKDVDKRLTKSRVAKTGKERLDAFIDAWGNYIPEIHGVGRALMAMKETDEEANLAWADRMNAVRHGCEAAINALHADGDLSQDLTKKQAIDLLWTLLSVRNWEQLTLECGWSQKQYIKQTKINAHRLIVSD